MMAQVLANNLNSTILICQRVARHMISKRTGRIINVSSVAGLAVAPGGAQASYAVAKAGVNKCANSSSSGGGGSSKHDCCCCNIRWSTMLVPWHVSIALRRYTKMLAAQLMEHNIVRRALAGVHTQLCGSLPPPKDWAGLRGWTDALSRCGCLLVCQNVNAIAPGATKSGRFVGTVKDGTVGTLKW